VDSETEKVVKKLLRTSKTINSYNWSSYQELKALLVQESQLMIALVMIMGNDLSGRNERFLR
tara:strand:- start:123 stop:308 length:186 start_codon:yes stop_codon:yes gene_type:complete